MNLTSFLGREETNHLKEQVSTYREQLEKQLEFSQALSETLAKSHKESNKVHQKNHKKPLTEKSNRPKVFYHLEMLGDKGNPNSAAVSVIWEAANSFNMDPIFQQGPTRGSRRHRK